MYCCVSLCREKAMMGERRGLLTMSPKETKWLKEGGVRFVLQRTNGGRKAVSVQAVLTENSIVEINSSRY
jgi:hypothetical protein